MKLTEPRAIKRIKAAYIAYSAVLIALGVSMMFLREDQMIIAARVAGVVLLGCGIVKFIACFTDDAYGLAFEYDFSLGIFAAIIGLLLIVHPLNAIALANILIGVFVITDGCFKLQTAKEAKRFGMKYWWMILIFALITALLGLLLVFEPLKSAVAITVICGVALIADGVENLYIALYTVRLIKAANAAKAHIYVDTHERQE